ncbi:hypothetical protein EVAR_78716_1 [Eumeta japonica]|uniref:Uncharacterized protein n=1 Tax=Eumeta variegata TaxID=151549 RepID=A0A4C1T241_EUMVA|nr:hypothetical protein EVAR_78716_1 [Eumeta japonica]
MDGKLLQNGKLKCNFVSWSEHNKDIDEATSTTSNALETSSQHSTMDCVDDENGMSHTWSCDSFAYYMPLRTVTTPCENSLDDNIQPWCSWIQFYQLRKEIFRKVQSQVYDDWEATAVEAMEEAAGREYDALLLRVE